MFNCDNITYESWNWLSTGEVRRPKGTSLSPASSPRGRGAESFVSAPFWPTLSRFVFEVGSVVVLCGPVVLRTIAIYSSRETNGSLIFTFAPVCPILSRFGLSRICRRLSKGLFFRPGEPLELEIREPVYIMVKEGQPCWRGAGVSGFTFPEGTRRVQCSCLRRTDGFPRSSSAIALRFNAKSVDVYPLLC